MRPKFLLRHNLNRLARWLRVLGYDAAVYQAIPRHVLISRAQKERRIFLSRCKQDMKLPTGVRGVHIISDAHLQQLRELLPLLELEAEQLFTRCIQCNRPLVEIDPARFTDRIPAYVAQTHQHFYLCRHCGKIYWPGTHHADMLHRVEQLFGQQTTMENV